MFTDLIVDVYHGNDIPDMKLASESGLVGMIHKASEGLFADSAYPARRSTARNLGLLWGAYHFGRTGNPSAQADFFLKTVGNDPAAILCLDLERDLSGQMMRLIEAELFVQRIKDATGEWPVVYTAQWVMDIINPSHKPTLLSSCPLWVASYTETPVLPFGWSTWTLHQFTNGQDGPQPHMIPGLGHNDYDRFNGTYEEMKQWWTARSTQPPNNGGHVTEKIMVTTDRLNVRAQPTTNSTALFALARDTKIVIDPSIVISANDYHWVKWLNGQGYVAQEFLKDNPPS